MHEKQSIFKIRQLQWFADWRSMLKFNKKIFFMEKIKKENIKK